jgi:hypothetical protein
MPMILPPVYLDVPAIIQPVAQSSGARGSFGAAIPHFGPGMPIARPLGSSSGPSVVPTPSPAPQPLGSRGGPDSTRSGAGAVPRPSGAD